MEENKELKNGILKSFSQEKKTKYNQNEKLIFNKFKTNVKRTTNLNFNKSIYNRVQNIIINDNIKINNSNNLNLKDCVNNKLMLQSQKFEKPIKIKKEQNTKILPILQNDKQINIINESLTAKKFLKLKKTKNTKKSANKSFFSVDKLKIKKPNARKLEKDLEIIRPVVGNGIKYINTFNSKINMKTSIIKKQKKYSPIISSNSNNITKRRGYSSHSVNIFKKKKLKIKNNRKIFSNKSSFNIIKSIEELKNDLTVKDNNNNKNDNNDIDDKNNNDNIYSNNNYSTRNKVYDYLITKYDKNDIINKNVSNVNNIEDINNSKKSLDQKKQTQIYFYVYHFFKSNNLFFFIPNSKYSQIKNKLASNSLKNINDNKNNINQINTNSYYKTIKNYEIIEDFYLPQAFRPRMNKWPNMPECITDTCKNGGFALIRNFDNCNLIWKLVHPNKMKLLIRNIHINQKYNHFISTFHLGRKDNLYKHFKYYKRIFPKMYNYAPATYILPTDGPDFEVEYKKNRKALWIVKPVNLSRGRGIHLLKGESEFRNLYKKSTQLNIPQYLISRYIDKPHLLNNKKYDLRLYVLVASFTPLRIYLYNNGLVRFATEDYKRGDLNNVFIHLTNYSINKNNLKYKSNNNLKNQQCEYFPREETEGTEAEGGLEGEMYNMEEGEENEDDNIIDDDSNKWSLIEYRNYFKKLGKNDVMEKIWEQIEAIVTKTIISVSKEYYKNIYPSKINNSFELYGFDILIDHNFRAWLIEVNVNPSLHCTSPLDLSIKTDLISDIFNVVGVLPYNHNGNRSVYNYSMINKKKDENKSIINNYISPTNKSVDKSDKKKIHNKSTKTEKEDFNNKMSIKSTILRNFDGSHLEKKLPEYDDEYYKKIIELYSEEKSRAHCTEFNLLFPLKNNIKTYGNILIKDNAVNDYNIVLWQHILTHE